MTETKEIVEMVVRYACGKEIETVAGEFVGVELGPLASICLPLKLDEGWRFISFEAIVDIACEKIPEALIVPVQRMVDAIEMHRSDFEHELERRKIPDIPGPENDTNWGHM